MGSGLGLRLGFGFTNRVDQLAAVQAQLGSCRGRDAQSLRLPNLVRVGARARARARVRVRARVRFRAKGRAWGRVQVGVAPLRRACARRP